VLKLETAAAARRQFNKTKHFNITITAKTDVYTDSELHLYASDLNISKKMNVKKMNVMTSLCLDKKIVKKSQVFLSQSLHLFSIVIDVIASLSSSELALMYNS